VKDSVPLFPLALVYIICIAGILWGLKYFGEKHNSPNGFHGLIGIGLFSFLIFF
jgi:hypothetical protein